MQPHAQQEGTAAVGVKAPVVSGALQPVQKAGGVLHHVAGVVGVIRRALIDGGGQRVYQGVQQIGDLFGVLHIRQADGSLRRQCGDQRLHLRGKGCKTAVLRHGVDELQHTDKLAPVIAQGHHQHGTGMVSGHGIVPLGTGKVEHLVMVYVRHVDKPVFQHRPGADMGGSQRNRRHGDRGVMSPLPQAEGARHHAAEVKTVLLQQIQGAAVTGSQVHGGVQDAGEQRLPVPFRGQGGADIQKRLHVLCDHRRISSPSRANVQSGWKRSSSSAAASSCWSV